MPIRSFLSTVTISRTNMENKLARLKEKKNLILIALSLLVLVAHFGLGI